MAKKHLLYIHDDRFLAEKNKSGLVNGLLEKHYGGVVSNIRVNEDKTISIKNPKLPAIIKTSKDIPETLQNHTVDFCKEGHAIPQGRSRCLGKGCKYA